MVNQALYDALSAFAKAACDLIGDRFPASRHVELISEALQHQKQGIYGSPWVLAGQILDRDLQDLPEFKKCLEAVNTDPVLSKTVGHLVGTAHSLVARSYRDIPMSPLFGLLEERPDFSKDDFDRIYLDLERRWYATTTLTTCVIVLERLRLEQPFSLPSGIQMLNATSTGLPHRLDYGRTLKLTQVALCSQFSLPLVVGEPDKAEGSKARDLETAHWDQLEEIVQALQIFKAGSFGIVGTYSIADVSPHSFRFRLSPGSSYHGQYSLSAADVASFIEFWKLFSVGVKKKQMGMAARRFSFSKSRVRFEDRFIDLVIAAEALLLGDSPGESAVKFKTNAAMLGSSPQERQRLLDLFGDAYNLRSKLAHGAADLQDAKIKKLFGTRTPNEFADEFEEALRGVIKIILLDLPYLDLGYDARLAKKLLASDLPKTV